LYVIYKLYSGASLFKIGQDEVLRYTLQALFLEKSGQRLGGAPIRTSGEALIKKR
jgi:hypothetical protein